MPDREKVIKWMENCVKGYEKACPEDCPYFQQCFPDEKAIPFMPLMQDAISLLKEQEEQEEIEYREKHPCEFCQEYLCDGCTYADGKRR